MRDASTDKNKNIIIFSLKEIDCKNTPLAIFTICSSCRCETIHANKKIKISSMSTRDWGAIGIRHVVVDYSLQPSQEDLSLEDDNSSENLSHLSSSEDEDKDSIVESPNSSKSSNSSYYSSDSSSSFETTSSEEDEGSIAESTDWSSAGPTDVLEDQLLKEFGRVLNEGSANNSFVSREGLFDESDNTTINSTKSDVRGDSGFTVKQLFGCDSAASKAFLDETGESVKGNDMVLKSDLDEPYYEVIRLLDYNPSNKEFLILWAGPDNEPSWEPRENLARNDEIEGEANCLVSQAGLNQYINDLYCNSPSKRKQARRTPSLDCNSLSRRKRARRTPTQNMSENKKSSRGVPRKNTEKRVTKRQRKSSCVSSRRKSCQGSSSITSERKKAMRQRRLQDCADRKPRSNPYQEINDSFHGRQISIQIGDQKGPKNFLQAQLEDRLIEITLKLPKSSGTEREEQPFPKNINFSGQEYELVSIKIDEDKDSTFKFSRGSMKVTLAFVSTAPCSNGDPFSIKDFLMQYGDFSVLDPRKIAARLELLQSPPRIEIQEFHRDHFCEIPETGNVGCGFISPKQLKEICKQGGLKHPELVSAIQVRLFIPALGIFKGVLQKKAISSGPGIQLPPSMKKVPAPKNVDPMNPAYLLVCKAGVHTAHGRSNDLMGRKLKKKLNAIKTFKGQIEEKPLKEMVLSLWDSLGVPSVVLNNYKIESQTPDRRNHAWVVGTVDPTGSLPHDSVFIPGMGRLQPHRIFVTRSPCLRHDHGRLLNTVQTKPAFMDMADWDFLQSIEFGSIIFSASKPGCKSIPERIACGDLDGDLYLICWDKIMLDHMKKAIEISDEKLDDNGELKTLPSNPNWLEEARGIMTNASNIADVGGLIGKLYNLSMEIARESQKKKEDPDAMAFADAYNEALEYKKHGRPIKLPAKLIESLPERFHALLTPIHEN